MIWSTVCLCFAILPSFFWSKSNIPPGPIFGGQVSLGARILRRVRQLCLRPLSVSVLAKFEGGSALGTVMELDIVPGGFGFTLAAKPHWKAQARHNSSVHRVGLVPRQVKITPP